MPRDRAKCFYPLYEPLHTEFIGYMLVVLRFAALLNREWTKRAQLDETYIVKVFYCIDSLNINLFVN